MITKNEGGSNLLSYDYSDPNAGIITNFHLESDKIMTLVDKMLESGQDCIQLVLPLSKTPPNNSYIQFNGVDMPPQYEINFKNFILYLERSGIKFVGIVPEFWHEEDFRQNNLTDFKIYNHFLFMTWIDSYLRSCRFDYCIDICAELDPSPNCIRNAQLLWTWWTATYFPNAAPCWNGTMSLIPKNDYNFIKEIFKGADPTGEPNWPARINLHAYRNETSGMLNALNNIGMPRRNIYIGECFTLAEDGSEDSYCEDLHNTILAYKDLYTFERIIQYPTKVFPVNGQEIDILPICFRY